jgi:hypothetical protein
MGRTRKQHLAVVCHRAIKNAHQQHALKLEHAKRLSEHKARCPKCHCPKKAKHANVCEAMKQAGTVKAKESLSQVQSSIGGSEKDAFYYLQAAMERIREEKGWATSSEREVEVAETMVDSTTKSISETDEKTFINKYVHRDLRWYGMRGYIVETDDVEQIERYADSALCKVSNKVSNKV